MSAQDAPDWQKVVETVTETGEVTDAPDWERVVVGPGGTPVGSAFEVGSSGLSGPQEISPGDSYNFGFTMPESGDFLMVMAVSVTTATTAGTYRFNCQPFITGGGTIVYPWNYITGSLYVPSGASAGADLTVAVPVIVKGAVAEDSEVYITVANDSSSAGAITYGDSSQSGISGLCGVVFGGS